jgi:RimJ/RimL family protein N-acetyltransferase
MEDTKEFVSQVILGSSAAKNYIMVKKSKEIPIGIVGLINLDYKNRNAECIIDIGEKNYWGKGYGLEGLKLLLNYAFYEMNLHRVFLRVYSFNERAIRLYTKIGFQEEGSSRQSLFRNGEWHDIIHMGILQNEYLRNK